MDVDRKRDRDWPHWPDRGNGSARRDRLERRLFRDTEREAELEQAQAAIRQIEEAAAAKAAQIERLERAVGQIAGPEAPEPEPEPEQELEPRAEHEPEPETEPTPAATYLVFVGTPSGYALEEAWGDAPVAGSLVALEGVEHVVAKVARSPLPGDDRRCAYLEPA